MKLLAVKVRMECMCVLRKANNSSDIPQIMHWRSRIRISTEEYSREYCDSACFCRLDSSGFNDSHLGFFVPSFPGNLQNNRNPMISSANKTLDGVGNT